ncbi:MAG: TIGR00730 family Rossman fold protein [Gemmatimonadaceae bacterium]|nr:TIGR00730 family Rossman fold protein [Gemmatimonadaceae bacterium]
MASTPTSFTPLRTPAQWQRIAVYCASNDGARPAYLAAARAMGTLLAQEGLTVVYGGGRVGLMGALADAAMAAGGEVIGVMPHGLVQREVAHHGLTALHVVDSMHERKALIADLADAFITMPGGIGTLEEFFETWTWAQLGVHRKPVGLLDTDGFWAPLEHLLDHVAAEGFLRGTPRDWLVRAPTPAQLLAALRTFEPPTVRRWLRLGET